MTVGTLVIGAALLAACAPVAAPDRTAGSTPAIPRRPAGPSRPRRPSQPGGSRPIGATERARVVRVVDGDTIVIDRGRGNERLRYIGIDTPESVKPDSPVEFMGREASAANAALVEGRDVVLEADVSERDPLRPPPALRLAARRRWLASSSTSSSSGRGTRRW